MRHNQLPILVILVLVLNGCDLPPSDQKTSTAETAPDATAPNNAPLTNRADKGHATTIDNTKPTSDIERPAKPENSPTADTEATADTPASNDKPLQENELILIEAGGEEGTKAVIYRDGQLNIEMIPSDIARESRYGVVFRFKNMADYLFLDFTGAFVYEFGQVAGGTRTVLMKGMFPEAAILERKSAVEVTFMGSYIEAFVNGEELFSTVIDNTTAGQIGFHFNPDEKVEIRNVVPQDLAQSPPNITGTLKSRSTPTKGQEVRAILLFDVETLVGAQVARTLTDARGNFTFSLPNNRMYVIEAGTNEAAAKAGTNVYGARFIDTHFDVEPLTVTLRNKSELAGDAQ